MGGALLDLVAKGGQDIYLICNPQISFFKKVYKRHTNFSVDFHKFFFDGEANFGKSTRVFIPRRGDLIKNLYLHLELPDLKPSGSAASYANFIGYNIIENVELYIGGSLIDKQTGEWLYVWNELSTEESKKRAYYEMVGGKPFNGYSSYNGNKGGVYIIPLSFWFGKDISQAIPHLALQYSEIEFRIKFRDFNDLWISSDGNAPTGNYKIKECQLSVEYVYLDNKERKLFAQSNHEYLIKQVQYSLNNHVNSGENKKIFNLNFNHPVLELIFFVGNKNTRRGVSESSRIDSSGESSGGSSGGSSGESGESGESGGSSGESGESGSSGESGGSSGGSSGESGGPGLELGGPGLELGGPGESEESSKVIDKRNINGNKSIQSRNVRSTQTTDDFKKKNNWLNFSKTLTAPFADPIKSAKILLNGQDRTPEMTSKELRFYNILEKHTSIPNNYIYVYSFSQKPEEYQPTGSCNFSRFDNKQIEVEFEDGLQNSDFKIYALNYNVLRISQGLAGLAYIN